MNSPFNYNAPQFLDFDLVKSGLDDSSADEWFGTLSYCYWHAYCNTSLHTDRWDASPTVEANVLEAKTPTNNEKEPSTSETENTPTVEAKADKVLTNQEKKEQVMKMFGKKLGSKSLGSPKRLLNKRCVLVVM